MVKVFISALKPFIFRVRNIRPAEKGIKNHEKALYNSAAVIEKNNALRKEMQDWDMCYATFIRQFTIDSTEQLVNLAESLSDEFAEFDEVSRN